MVTKGVLSAHRVTTNGVVSMSNEFKLNKNFLRLLKFDAVQYAYPNVNLHLPTFVSQDMVGLPFCSPLKIAHFFIALTLNCFACIERSMNNLSRILSSVPQGTTLNI